jgi:hypothetical protein
MFTFCFRKELGIKYFGSSHNVFIDAENYGQMMQKPDLSDFMA